MKYNKILYICIFLFVRCDAAADDTAEKTTLSKLVVLSSHAQKREAPSCARAKPYITKRQRCAFGGLLKLSRVVPGGRGKSCDEVNLTQEDHLSKYTFTQHMKDDFELGIPWIIATVNYKTDQGLLARDFGDGRYWHKYWNTGDLPPANHPLYNGQFIGEPEYYIVERKNGKVEAVFLGSEEDIWQATPHGRVMELMLDLEQKPELWMRISSVCFSSAQYERALKWLYIIAEQLPHGIEQSGQLCNLDAAATKVESLMPYLQEKGVSCGHLLEEIGYAYYREEDDCRASDYLRRALAVLENEPNKSVGMIYSFLGDISLNAEEFDAAVEDFSNAKVRLKAEGKKYGRVLKYIGYAYYANKKWAKAVDAFQAAVPILNAENKSTRGALHSKAKAYFKLELWGDSIRSFKKILGDCAPGPSSDIWNFIGFARERQGRISDAVSAYTTSCKRDDAYLETNFINLLYHYAVHRDQCRVLTDVSMKTFAQKLLDCTPGEEMYYLRKCPERYAIAKQEAERLVALGNQSADDSVGANFLLLPSASPEY